MSAAAQGAATSGPDESRIVICGGGVIGASTAYYLAKRGQRCTIVERAGVANAASGNAGGFLALDWNDSTAVGPLARLSYKLHAGLEEELGCELDYRQLDTFSVEAWHKGGLLHAQRGHKKLPDWLDGHIVQAGKLGDTSTTAQVHPRKLTEAFVHKAAELAGTAVHTGTVQGLDVHSAEGGAREVRGVIVDGETVAADAVVIAMGPWSKQASDWLGRALSVSGQKYHSAVLRSDAPITATALFTHVKETAAGVRHEPEVYPRPHGEVYVCGEPDSSPLPDDPADVRVAEETCDSIIHNCSFVASCLEEAEVVRRQACYLPLSLDGLPLIGGVPGVGGAYVATGHSCWGILNAPATGLAMSELLLDGGAACVDLAPFAPGRLM